MLVLTEAGLHVARTLAPILTLRQEVDVDWCDL